jgi:hypothetical protein
MNNETIKACVNALCVLIVAGAGLLGFDLDEGLVQNALSALAFLAGIAWAIWKNFNFTAAAQSGQMVTDSIKRGEMR